MVTKQAVKKDIEANLANISRLGVSRIGLFGSLVRNEQTADSDIDILVDFKEGQETFDNFINVCNLLETLFQHNKVDVVTLKGLSPHIGPYILKEVEYVGGAN